jgi:hypothetical protein
MKTLKRSFFIAGAVTVAALSGTDAQAFVLTFDGNICNGGQACADYNPIDQTYGDVAGQLDVVYAHRAASGNSPVDENYLKWWDNAYNDLVNVAWGGFGTGSGVSEIALIPAAGYQVTLNSFDLGAWPNAANATQYTVYDINYNPLISSGPIIVGTGNVHSHVTPALASATGLIIQWGPDGYNVGIDNVDFTVAVPLPAAAWLFGSALGLLGLRRKTVTV